MQQFMNLHLNDRTYTLRIVLLLITFKKPHAICHFDWTHEQKIFKM